MYLGSLQKGLQTAHVVSDLAMASVMDSKIRGAFMQWACTDKTIIVLNGGNSASLEAFEKFLGDTGCQWPWAAFREDEQSLNGAITAVGVVVPESVYQNTCTNANDLALAAKLQALSLAV
jgi:hypothetical protein